MPKSVRCSCPLQLPLPVRPASLGVVFFSRHLVSCDENALTWGIFSGEFAYDYVELTREVLNDDDAEVEGASHYSRDTNPFDPREKNSIPLSSTRIYAGSSSQHRAR